MADKPSRALVVYGDGFAPLVRPSHAHIHSLASLASCGFLSVRSPPPSATEEDRSIHELALLLDAHDSEATISERFMGLKACMFTASPGVASFARKLGFSVSRIDDLINCDATEELLRLLGFEGGEVLEKSEFDMVFLHVGSGEKKINIGWIDALVGGVIGVAQPQSRVASRLHLSLILSYGDIPEEKENVSAGLVSRGRGNSDLCLLRPRQSYTMRGGKLLDDIRHHHPMLIAQWQDAVTRRDTAKQFLFREFEEHGGNLAMLAYRFLHEVAFKLWKAPKYGA
ncbi:hypothetical protein QJS10_CPA06g00559 [Acorus calamus]|uniref:AT5G11810-like protein n=1 Tax=Acorus calamus TaxID=4465 RepID=A0AAV9EM71_ACOCL|nr:hypothetical protein QJS10_CPA06g00559 [Acorus calamus]